MENKIEIITDIMADMPENERLEIIETCKIIHLFLYHLAKHNEVALGRVWRIFNTPEKKNMAENVIKNLGLKKIQRKKSSMAKRSGTAWVKKK